MSKLTAQDKKWRAQEDLRTLVSAGEINKDPTRVAAVKKESLAQQRALQSVTKKVKVKKSRRIKK